MKPPVAKKTESRQSAPGGDGVSLSAGLKIASASADVAHARLPPLARDTSFWGMAATQFLGAFNDNLFKQLILLLATPTAAQLAAGTAKDRQGEAQFVFAASFLIFSGFAGFVADRVNKRRVVILSKVAEIVAMLLGMIGFFCYGTIGLTGMLVVLFLMGAQSAFFGPAKYGILPETLRAGDLPRANGIFLMLTFLAIIFGTALAGPLSGGRLWLGSMMCVGIAIVGTATSFLVRRVHPAQPELKHQWSQWGVSRHMRQLLWRDRELLWAILAVAVFWMVGGVVLPTVNALGITQLGLGEDRTSLLTASVGLGIAVGCVVGGYLSRGRVNRTVVTIGSWGIVATLAVMSLPGGQHGHLLGFWGSIPVLILVGLSAGLFIVPVQVELQSRPPKEEKGRMIATMNQFSWVGVILGAVLYQACLSVLNATGWPRSTIFGITAVLILPVAIFYRPQDEPLSTK
jgi:acyl-[acyl-carrier-protein]-phospholipid O-acyltransferase/long-chain-fatty-acid--[acyl-carrier-protein] ligase